MYEVSANTNKQASPSNESFILIVEDDAAIRDLLTDILKNTGFFLRTAIRRADIIEMIDSGRCRAIILDLGLPNDDGIAIAKLIRKQSDIPIIMLTGRVGIHDRVLGLDAGADDYILKPFAAEELIARLKAVLRRIPENTRTSDCRIIRLNESTVDLTNRTITGPLGSDLFTLQELRLLLALVDSKGPLSRPAAYRSVFKRPWQPEDRSLDVHIASLRKKLRKTSGSANMIMTLRGEGYEIKADITIE